MGHLFTFLFVLFSIGCTSLFFQPTRQEYFSPTEKVGLKVEELAFESLDRTKLHGWWFPALGKEMGTVIHFHGNAENMTSHFLSVAWVVKYGYNLFTFDYRGYGKSDGAPYPAGAHQDALAAFEQVRGKMQNREQSVIIYAQSLGGVIALRALEDLQDRTMVRGVVIEGSFLSYRSMGRQALSRFWLTWPVQWISYFLVSDTYGPKKHIAKLAPIPILFLHGTQDKTVPISHGKDLFEATPQPKCFWPIESSSHINLMNIEQGRYRPQVLKFFETLLCPETMDSK